MWLARHESLRTVFAVADGQPYQHIVPAGQARASSRWRSRRWRAPDEVAGLVAAAAGYVFDLAGELPVRAWLFAVGAG